MRGLHRVIKGKETEVQELKDQIAAMAAYIALQKSLSPIASSSQIELTPEQSMRNTPKSIWKTPTSQTKKSAKRVNLDTPHRPKSVISGQPRKPLITYERKHARQSKIIVYKDWLNQTFTPSASPPHHKEVNSEFHVGFCYMFHSVQNIRLFCSCCSLCSFYLGLFRED